MRRYSPLAAAAAALLTLAACQDAPLATGGPAARTGPPALSPPSNDIRTGWIHGPGGEPMEVRFKVVEGWAIYQDDINLGRADKVAATREELERRTGGARHGVVIDGSQYRWPGGQVPYVIASSFSAYEQQTIANALAHVTANAAGVRFVPRTSESAYLVFAPHASVCNSYVGRQNNAQTVNLTSGCAQTMGIVVHEALHALGMWHEQSRCDRDTYVTINLANVLPLEQHNFDKKCTNATDLYGYDEGSVMHYGPYAFSSNGQPTITSKRGLGHLMGQRNGMSSTDVSTVRHLYPPRAPYFTTIQYGTASVLLGWSGADGATSYTVWFSRDEEHFMYDWTIYYQRTEIPLGPTSATYLTDYDRFWTGNSYCFLAGNSREPGNVIGSTMYSVQAHYPSGETTYSSPFAADVCDGPPAY